MTHLVESDALELAADPLPNLIVGGLARDRAPVLGSVRLTRARDRGEFLDVTLDPIPVDARILLLGSRQTPPQIVLVLRRAVEVFASLGAEENRSVQQERQRQ